MLDNLRIHQTFTATLLLAAGRIRSNGTEGMPAWRVNTLVI